MIRKLILNAANPEEIRIAILAEGRLEELEIEAAGNKKKIKGNIYKARVVAVEPSLNAAFIDYGADKQGFLTAGDVDPQLSKKKLDDDKNTYTIDELLEKNQEVLVQVNKDEVGNKGAVLTTYLSLPGRYLVLTPDSKRQGVSRKIIDDQERETIRRLVSTTVIPDGVGVILRAAGRDKLQSDLRRDLGPLVTLWNELKKRAKKRRAPALIFEEQDVILRALRDYFSSEIDEIILDTDDTYDRAVAYVDMVMPRQRHMLSRYVERRPIFHHYGVESQLDALFSPNVELSSGGSIVIEPTEALVSIDVNSGKQKLDDHEKTATQTNIEAAEEIARQLRLRDLGGIIVMDFIDMTARKNQSAVEKTLRQAMARDKARIKIGRISRNGTLEVTRQRIKSALSASIFRCCAICDGTGRTLNPSSHAVRVLRKLEDRASRCDLASARVQIEAEAADLLRIQKWGAIQEIERRYDIRIDIDVERIFAPGQAEYTFVTDPTKKPVELDKPDLGPVFIPEEIQAEIDAEEAEEARLNVEAEKIALEKEAAERAANPETAAIIDTDDSSPTSNKRGRGRRRGAKESQGRGKSRGGDVLELPSFEMVDPASLGLKLKKKPKGPNAQTNRGADEGDQDRKPRKRRRRRKPRSAEERQAYQDAAAAKAMAVAEPIARPGFFKRLFGWFSVFSKK